MFKKLTITFAQPICSCTSDAKYSWQMVFNDNPDQSLRLIVYCDKCKTTTAIPYEEIVADFHFEKPRPEPNSLFGKSDLFGSLPKNKRYEKN